MNKFFNHFKTVTRHRHEVFKLCCKAGLPWRGLVHDLSKYSPAEFLPGAKYWTGTRSPQEGERKEYGYSAAWLHHKGRNKHHFEYWTDYVPGKGLSPIEMPKVYLVEMFCDRIAACKIYQGDQYTDYAPLSYYERSHKHYFMNENTSHELYLLLKMLNDEGEKKTFAYIKNEYLRK